MSTRSNRSQGWLLFPPAPNTPNNTNSKTKTRSKSTPSGEMNVHQPRRLSPIPRSDDQDSDYGGAADVKNIPFYRPSRKSVDKASFDVPRSAGATHELAALVSQGEVPVYVPLRSSSRHASERNSLDVSDLLHEEACNPLEPPPRHLPGHAEVSLTSYPTERLQFPRDRSDSRSRFRQMSPISEPLEQLSYPQERPQSRSQHHASLIITPYETVEHPQERPDSRSQHHRPAPMPETPRQLDFSQERPESRNQHSRATPTPEPLARLEQPSERTDTKAQRRTAHLSDPGERSEYPQERSESRNMHHRGLSSGLQSPSTMSRSVSRASERTSYQTDATSLAPLQTKNLEESDQLEPLNEEDLDPGSFDLVAPAESAAKRYSLESRSELLFSKEHLQVIFADPSLLLRFTAFLSASRASSIPILIYYLDAIKALKAISYSNAIAEALEPIKGFDFTATIASKTFNANLEAKAMQAFDVMVREDLPAFITHTYIQTVSLSIQRRITGTLSPHLREASEGLAEVFCLTDPSRPDNPIVFASEEFHRTTQYGMSYVIGRNCRFLQGPKTNPFSVRRIREMIEAGKEHCEVFLNYRRDGSPFMNLLMCAPLCDSRGTIRYFIGAQVDVSGLVKECADMESLKRLVVKTEAPVDGGYEEEEQLIGPPKDEFQELSEMLNLQELDTVRRWGGRMHKEHQEESQDNSYRAGNWAKPRVLINSTSPDGLKGGNFLHSISGRLSGIYENYLLVRPYPSLRVLFASPSLRVPGILQSPFMAKIGGSDRVRQELTQALADGRGVTAKVKWVSKADMEPRNRWIHCTPLLGNNGAIGVWMIVIVDDEQSQPTSKRFKTAPPVDPKFGRTGGPPASRDGSLRDFALANGGQSLREQSLRHASGSIRSNLETERSGSPYTLRID